MRGNPVAPAPAWRLAAAHALFWAACMSLFGRFEDGRSWTHSAEGAAIAGAVFGAAMWWFVYRKAVARRDATLAHLTRAQRAAAYQAAVRGPVPADPAVRQAALRLVGGRLDASLSHRAPVAALSGALALISVLAAVFASPWWVLAALAFGLVLAQLWRTPARHRRRRDELSRLSRG